MSSAGASWARTSARTLARKLRRKNRALLGQSSAQALHYRLGAMRRALLEHWQLEEALGACFSQLSEAIQASKLVGISTVDAQAALTESNWAKHGPSPCAPPRLPPQPRGAVLAAQLEAFRVELHSGEGELEQDMFADSECGSKYESINASDADIERLVDEAEVQEPFFDASEVEQAGVTDPHNWYECDEVRGNQVGVCHVDMSCQSVAAFGQVSDLFDGYIAKPDGQADADEEELEEVPQEEKDADGLYGALVDKNGHLGCVEDLHRGAIGKEKLYLVEYEDMDQEHFSREQVVQYRIGWPEDE